MREYKTFSNAMSEAQIRDLLDYIGVEKIKHTNGRGNIMFCCPVHNESNPSSGINIDLQVFNCFSCHYKGSIPWFLVGALPDEFPNLYLAEKFIRDRYDVDYESYDTEWREKGAVRFSEDSDEFENVVSKFTQPLLKIAPYKSGKETYSYFYERGFDKHDVKKYKIGRDLKNETITIPVFWEDDKLCGVIGRYIDPSIPSNMRYKVYDFPKSDILYPINFYQSKRDRVYLVEGNLDALWCHKHGATEVLALQTNAISKAQAQWILDNNIHEVVDMTDNDKMGAYATDSIKKAFKDKPIKLLTCKHLYPSHAKDPQDCNLEELWHMINHPKSNLVKSAPRFDG